MAKVLERRQKKPKSISTITKRKKMPETAHHMNGYANGHTPPELQQEGSFLFTSESVGEGHPGRNLKKHAFTSWLFCISDVVRLRLEFHVGEPRVPPWNSMNGSYIYTVCARRNSTLPSRFLTFLKSFEMWGWYYIAIYSLFNYLFNIYKISNIDSFRY